VVFGGDHKSPAKPSQ
jgi:hypothetical protein